MYKMAKNLVFGWTFYSLRRYRLCQKMCNLHIIRKRNYASCTSSDAPSEQLQYYNKLLVCSSSYSVTVQPGSDLLLLRCACTLCRAEFGTQCIFQTKQDVFYLSTNLQIQILKADILSDLITVISCYQIFR